MKIWVQSCAATAKGAFAEYGQALEEYVKKVGRPGTVVDVHGVSETAPGIDNFHFAEHITTHEVVHNALTAEQQGYDAFVMVSTIDAGYYEVRELVKIPALFITETSILLSCQLAPKFAFFTHSDTMLRRGTELGYKYNMEHRMAPGISLGITYNDFPDLYHHPDKYMSRILEAGRKAVAAGADILIPAGNPFNMFLLREGVREIDGAPVLDVCGSVIKAAEMLVDLKAMGTTRSRHGAFGQPSEEQLAIARKRYGM